MVNSILNNLKINCWNIQGLLNDKTQDESFTEIINAYDCTILLETWLNHNVSISGYYTFCLNAEKSSYGRSKGGIAIVLKNNLRKGIKILEKVNSHMLWIKFGKDFLNINKDLYLCAIYIPPVTSVNAEDICELWDKLEEYILRYNEQGYIMITGDINSRIGSSNEESDLYDVNILDNVLHRHNPLNLRNSKDQVINKSGRKLLELCRHTNLVIVNGRTMGDLEGKCTSFQYNGSSVIDYCIVDRQLYDSILYFNVHDVTHISDHAPISVCMNISTCIFPMSETGNNAYNYSQFPQSFKWNEARYTDAIKLQQFQDRSTVICINNYNNNIDGVNNLCKDVSNLFIDAAKLSLSKRKKQRVVKYKHKPAKWYSSNLRVLKNDVLHTGKLLSRFPKDPHIRGKFISKKKHYKQACRKAKLQYMNDIAVKLDNAEVKNPQQFWRLINSLKRQPTNISDLPSIKDFVNIFKDASQTGEKNIPDVFKQNIEHSVNMQKCRVINFLDDAISSKELKQAIDKLNNGKSCSDDLIMNEMLKASLNVFEKLLLKLFNMCLSSEVLIS